MTAGSTEVELWGGTDGLPHVEADDAKFYFIKAAVSPKKDVEPHDTDTKQGMITELLYVLDDSPPPKVEEITPRRRQPLVEVEDNEVVKTPVEDTTKSILRKRQLNIEDEKTDTSLARRRPIAGIYSRWQPSMTTLEPATSKWAGKEKTPEIKDIVKSSDSTEVTSFYLRKKADEKVAETPGFLRPKLTTTTASDNPFGERLPRATTRTTAPSWTRSRITNDDTTPTTSSIVRRYGRDTTTTTASSRYGRDSPSSRDTTSTSTSSRAAAASDSATSSPSLYGRDSITSSYRKDSTKDTTSGTGSSLYRTDSSASRYGQDADSAVSRYSSRYGRDSSGSRYGSGSYQFGYGTGYSSSRYLSSYTSRYR